jgi:hypothetical protein
MSVEDSEKAPNLAEDRYPLVFNVPVGMSSRYAHHMTVQVSNDEVTLSFFEVIAPIVLGSAEEQREAAKKGLRADCVARVTLAKARYFDFLEAMKVAELIQDGEGSK